jgi:hypothetical protein
MPYHIQGMLMELTAPFGALFTETATLPVR